MIQKLLRHIPTLVLLLTTSAASAQFVFIPNQGQWEGDFLYKSKVPGGTVYLEKNGFTLSLYDNEQMKAFHAGTRAKKVLDGHALKIRLVGCNEASEIIAFEQDETYYNYFLGNDTSKWASGLHGVHRIRYKEVYPGIDFEIYSYQDRLKYQFFVSPEADPSQIKIEYRGAENLLLEAGNLAAYTSIRKVVEESPLTYQTTPQKGWHEVASQFVLTKNILSFDLAEYDKAYQLVIDPTLMFSTFSGSLADNFGYTATFDDLGHGYSGGTVYSDSFPVTSGAFQTKWGGGAPVNTQTGNVPRDIGILKYSPKGTQLLFATYIGGKHNEDPHSMVVNSNRDLVIFGNTGSDNFPVTANAYDTSYNGNFDIYVAVLANNGKSMKHCTYVGGSGRDGLNGDHVIDINRGVLKNSSPLGFNYGDVYRGEVIVDSLDNIYIATTTASTDLPASTNAFQGLPGGKHDACLLKFNSDLTKLNGLTYFGGDEQDAGYGIALDKNLNIYFCGGTRSQGLPMPSGTYQRRYNGNRSDGIIVHLSNDFTQLLGGTYFGTNKYDQAYFIQTDSFDNVYVAGQTTHDTFPIKDAKWSEPRGKQFISSFSKRLDSLRWSSTFGTNRPAPDLSPSAFLVDNCGRIFFSGWGGSSNFFGNTSGLTTSSDALKRTSNGADFYLAVFARDMDTLLYSTYFGGDTTAEHVDGGTSRFDKDGIVYQSVCAGCGGFSDFPTTPNAVSRVNRGIRPAGTPTGCNNALFKLDLYTPDLVADFLVPSSPCRGEEFQLFSASLNAETYLWDFGDGSKSTDKHPKHTYSSPGTYLATLVASNPITCAYKDTIQKQIRVLEPADASFTQELDTCNKRAILKFDGKNGSSFYWDFGDGDNSGQQNPQHVYDTAGTYNITLLVDTLSFCADTLSKTFTIPKVELDYTFRIDTCNREFTLLNRSINTKGIGWQLNGSKRFGDSVVMVGQTGSNNLVFISDPFTDCPETLSTQAALPALPVADFVFNIDSCSSKVLFRSTTLNEKGLRWDFGNGDTSILNSKEVAYGDTGSYVVTLTADPFSDCADIVEKTIDIELVKFPKFDVEIDQCTYEVRFLDESINAKEHFWEFGDGATDEGKKPNPHVYTAPGSYQPLLIIDRSNADCIDSFSMEITLDTFPEADFEFENEDCLAHFRFKNVSKRGVDFTWYFGDGSTDKEESPDRLFPVVDSAWAAISVTSENGCVDSIRKTFFVDSVFTAEFEFTIDTCGAEINLKNTSTDAYAYEWQLNDKVVSNKRSPRNIEFENIDGTENRVVLSINPNSKCADTTIRVFNLNPFDPEKIFIPNVFTPNYDDLNDRWEISELNSKCEEYEVVIYNRWGERLYEQKGPEIWWDGKTENDKRVQSGVYFYLFTSPHGQKSGTITVIH